jgi:hypothetical protein
MTAALEPMLLEMVPSTSKSQRNIEGRLSEVGFDGCSLRSDCRQGSMSASRRFASLVPRSASLTASSLQLLLFYGGNGRSPFL